MSARGQRPDGVTGCAAGAVSAGAAPAARSTAHLQQCLPCAFSDQTPLPPLPRAPVLAPVTQLLKVAGWRLGLRPRCLFLLLIVLIITPGEHHVPSIRGQDGTCCLFRCLLPELCLLSAECAGECPAALASACVCQPRCQELGPRGGRSLSSAPSHLLPRANHTFPLSLALCPSEDGGPCMVSCPSTRPFPGSAPSKGLTPAVPCRDLGRDGSACSPAVLGQMAVMPWHSRAQLSWHSHCMGCRGTAG